MLVVGTYAESPPSDRSVLMKFEVYRCWMTDGGQGSLGNEGQRTFARTVP